MTKSCSTLNIAFSLYVYTIYLYPLKRAYVRRRRIHTYVSIIYVKWSLRQSKMKIAFLTVKHARVQKSKIKIKIHLLWTWHRPTENCPSSGICRNISSVTKWTPRCCGRRFIFLWNHAEPICNPRFEAMLVFPVVAYIPQWTQRIARSERYWIADLNF